MEAIKRHYFRTLPVDFQTSMGSNDDDDDGDGDDDDDDDDDDDVRSSDALERKVPAEVDAVYWYCLSDCGLITNLQRVA